MVKSGKNQSRQAGLMAMIDDMRLDIKQLEAQTLSNQGIYDDMAQEIKAKLEQRIKEVKEGARILVSADLQAANLASDQKFKALEVKVDDANEQLNRKIEALETQNQQLES
jgi:hypothetical protein